MALSFPREPYMEMFLGATLGWVDVTDDLRQTARVSITRGRSNEQGKIAPSKMTLSLTNPGGKYSPSNPASEYVDVLTRNTPIRGGLKVARDAFSRTVSNGWGSTDTGDVWSTIGTPASDFSTNGSVGRHSINGTSVWHATYLGGLPMRNAHVRVAFTLPFTNVTGDSLEPANILLRGQSDSEFYMVRPTINTAEQLRLEILYTNGSDTSLAGPVTIPGITHASGQSITIAAEIEQQTIRAKAFLTSGVEPYAWHLSVVDEADSITLPGWVGIRSGVAGSNTNSLPIVFSYDNLQVRKPRAAMEIADLKPRWDVSHTDKWVEVEAAGILRRLGQSTTNAKTAIERFVVSHGTQPAAYWPLDDGELTRFGRVAAGSGTPADVFDGNFPEVFGAYPFGTGKLSTWLPSAVAINDNHVLFCKPETPLTGSYTLHFALRFKQRYSPAGGTDGIPIGTSGFPGWTISFFSSDYEVDVAGPSGSSIGTVETQRFFDDSVHHLGFRATQDGSDIDWALFIDGETLLSGTVLATTNPTLTRALFQQNGGAENDRVRNVGHVAIYSGDGPPVADYFDALMGHDGEAAGRRLERTCDQNNIPFSHLGSLDATAAMGPQRPEPILKILRDCEDADRGTLSEPLGVAGLHYRTLGALCNQASVATLSYSGGHVAPPLQPRADDPHITNDVTANRRDGGEYRVVQTVGPLNVNDPGDDPDGVGTYDVGPTFNVATDEQLPDLAGWIKHLGTVDEDRYPKVRVDLAATNVDGDSEIELSVLDIDIDDRFTITNLTAADIYGSVEQIARGSTEVIDTAHRHDITFNTAPESPYRVLELDSAIHGRLDTAGSVLAVAVNESATALQIATTVGPLWTTDAADFPMPVVMGREEMTVTDIDNELITFVAVGVAAHADNAMTTPALPAGWQQGDLLVVITATRDTGAVAAVPSGYTQIFNAEHFRIGVKIAGASESAPSCLYSASSAGTTNSAQVMAIRGKFYNPANLVSVISDIANPSGNDINYPGLRVTEANSFILYAGWKQDDFTAATSPGTEIAEASSTVGNDQSLVWAYQIQTSPTTVASGVFALTGGAAAISKGVVLAIRCDRQAFTVTRNTNVLPGGKTHVAGTSVEIAHSEAVVLGLGG